MNLNQVHKGITKNRKRTRVGRGHGSGLGETSGRGGKGQTARHGWKSLPTFEGGQMPLVRRIPKRGFTNSFALVVAEINLRDLEIHFEAGAEVTPAKLRELALIHRVYDVVKVLGTGKLTKKLKVSAHRFSKSAAEQIAQAGGETVVLPGKAPVVKNKQKSSQKK